MPIEGDLSANLILRRGALARVGLERIALVEAVGELGSITAAAKQMGLSYKGAWDAIQALNNLFDAPLIAASAGGKAGGAALVTPRGLAVIKAFREVEREIGAALSRLEAGLAGAPDDQGLGDLFWSLGLRTSARNALRGTVVRIGEGTVTAEVTLSVGDGVEITSMITRHSVEELGLTVGKPAIALIKSSFVMLTRDLTFAGTNRLSATIVEREDGESDSEIRLALMAGKTLVATVARLESDELKLAIGQPVIAVVKPANVILAVE